MKIAAGILTWNHFKTGRADLFRRTVESIARDGVPYQTVTNGSTDGTDLTVRSMGGIVDNKYSQVWYGMELAIGWCLSVKPEIVLFSADDIEYRPGWAARLAAFWEAAPANIVLASLMLEPMYSWNGVYSQGEAGGERYVLRESVGGCCWSFRAADWPKIGPIPQVMPGEDLQVCRRLREAGLDIAALDLADHAGERASAWGNQSWTYAQYTDWSVYGFHA